MSWRHSRLTILPCPSLGSSQLPPIRVIAILGRDRSQRVPMTSKAQASRWSASFDNYIYTCDWIAFAWTSMNSMTVAANNVKQKRRREGRESKLDRAALAYGSDYSRTGCCRNGRPKTTFLVFARTQSPCPAGQLGSPLKLHEARGCCWEEVRVPACAFLLRTHQASCSPDRHYCAQLHFTALLSPYLEHC